MTWFLGVSKKT